MVLKQGNFNIKSLFNKNELKKDYKGLERITFKDLDCDERMNIVSREEFLNECEVQHDKIDEAKFNEMKDTQDVRSDNQDHLESQIYFEDRKLNLENNQPDSDIIKENEEEAMIGLVEDEEDVVQVKQSKKETEEQEEQFEDDFEGENPSTAKVDIEQ